MSGGVTLLGWGAGLLGAMLPAAFIFAWPSGGRAWPLFLVISAAAFLGALVDSLLGGSAQALYRCRSCGAITEAPQHCGNTPTTLVRGLRWLNNDLVNLVSTVAGGAIALGLLYGSGLWALMP